MRYVKELEKTDPRAAFGSVRSTARVYRDACVLRLKCRDVELERVNPHRKPLVSYLANDKFGQRSAGTLRSEVPAQ